MGGASGSQYYSDGQQPTMQALFCNLNGVNYSIVDEHDQHNSTTWAQLRVIGLMRVHQR